MTMTTHTANWLATRSATHGQRTTTAVSDSKRCENREREKKKESARGQESFDFRERERERERLHASERGASFNSGASYDANGQAKQSSKHYTHTHTQSHAEGGKTAEQTRANAARAKFT